MPPWSPEGKVDVEDILDVLEVDNLRREGLTEYRFSCPFPVHMNGDVNASCYMNSETTSWYCHGCKRKGGDCIPFVSYMLGISPIKAKKILREAYDPASFNIEDRDIAQEVRDYIKKRENPIKKQMVNKIIPDAAADEYSVDWDAAWAAYEAGEGFAGTDYMFERGFEPQTLQHWGFGWDELSGRVTFQVRDEQGRLVGFKGRSVGSSKVKYLTIGDAEGGAVKYGHPRYFSGLVAFGLWEAKQQESETLIVCEGELNAIALWQMGFKNSVALNGSRLTKRQSQLIRRKADEVIMFFDFDAAGQSGMWGFRDEKGWWHPGAIEALAKDCSVRLVGQTDDDAADFLKRGDIAGVTGLLDSAESHLKVALEMSR